MVGGDEYNELPFNLATQGQRQPGSSIKPFILAEALNQGISPNSVWSSRKLEIDVPRSKEIFTVNNYEGAYAGITTLARATTFSDNSVFAQVGIKVGTEEDRATRRADGDPHERLDQLRDDARRPQAGRHAARHGACVPDVRQPRPARVRLAQPGGRATASSAEDARPGRHPADRAPPGRRLEAARPAGRRRRPSTSGSTAASSTRGSPTRSARSSRASSSPAPARAPRSRA